MLARENINPPFAYSIKLLFERVQNEAVCNHLEYTEYKVGSFYLKA